MATEFTLPDVGEGLAEAEIVRWLIAEGDPVREDDAIVEVETDKALVQITSPVTGVLSRHGAAVGEMVPVGSLLAVFTADGEEVAPAPSPATDTAASATAPAQSPAAQPPTAAPAGRKPRATPATRKLARSLGVDLSEVPGSGPGGRILDEDVRRVADGAAAPLSHAANAPRVADPTVSSTLPTVGSAPASPAPMDSDERIPLRGLRRTIARTMTESWTTVPHVNSIHEVDLHALVGLREQLAAADRKVPVTAFLVRAAALALRDFPVLNASVDTEREEIVLRHRRNIGVAVDAPEGLIVPVIEDADHKSVGRIGEELRELAAAARDRSIGQERLRGSTFTVNNYGPLGGWFGTSLLKPPEVGILSIGPARDQVVPRDGEIVIRPIAAMALAADHRVADGREIIGFCVAVRELLESPLRLLVEE